MMYKYEQIAKEIKGLLITEKKKGNKSIILSAKDIEYALNVSERCGASSPSRYPLICQAMNEVSKTVKTKYISGKCPSSTYTVEYVPGFFL